MDIAEMIFEDDALAKDVDGHIGLDPDPDFIDYSGKEPVHVAPPARIKENRANG